MSVLWEHSGLTFFFITCVIGGGAAWMTGRALALGWRPAWQLAIYVLLLGLAVRFVNFALFEGTLLSFRYYLADVLVLAVFAALAYRVTRTSQMATQYHWLYRQTSPLSWTDRESE